MTSRGLSILESQQRTVPQHTNFASFGGSEAPMNLNYFGGQQQMGGQQPGMLPSLPFQHSGINDAQLMQQQVMYKQMQELQRRQQAHQSEIMHRNAMNHMPTFPNQLTEQHSQPTNGNPVQNASNYPWQSQVTDGETKWQQSGYPSAMHSYSNGQQGQTMHFMGSATPQTSQSFYGVPVSSMGDANLFSQNSNNKPGGFHFPAPNNSFSGNPFAPHAEQVSFLDARPASRSGSEGRTFEHVPNQRADNAVSFGSVDQVHQMKGLTPTSNGQGFLGSSDVSVEKSLPQAAVSQPSSSQAAIGLDPTEEKILFGDNDNIWEAFGDTFATENDEADLSNGFPSVQSRPWSALMQSAAAETSNSDNAVQEEWSGLDPRNSRSQSGNQPLPTCQDNEKPPAAWINSSEGASLGSRTASNNVLQERRKWLESNSPKPYAEEMRKLDNPNSSKDLSKIDSGLLSRQQIHTPGGGVADIHATENSDGRESSYDSHQNSYPSHDLSGSSRENTWSDAGDRQCLPGSAGSNLSDMDKGRVFGYHGGLSSNAHMGNMPSTSAPFGRSGGNFSPNQRLLPSQNMLELLHKVDQSEDHSAVSNLSSVNYNKSSEPAGGYVGSGQSQPSTSHGYNLQLAPPQGIALSNLNDPVRSSLGSVGSPSQHTNLNSNPMNFRNPFQNQHTTTASGQTLSNLQFSSVSADGRAYHDQRKASFQNEMRGSIDQRPPSTHAALAGMKDNMSLSGPYLRTQQQMVGVQARSGLDMNSFSQLQKEELDDSRSIDASQKDANVFHHSLKPNSMAYDGYPSLHQMQAMKTMDMDLNHRESKRVRGLVSGLDAMAEKSLEPSTHGLNIMAREPSAGQSSISSGDVQFGNRKISSESSHGIVPSHDMRSFSHSDSQKYVSGDIASIPQLTGIRPQMPPSWFGQYGVCRNGQLLPAHNTGRFSMVQNVERKLINEPSNLAVQNSMQLENAVSNTCQTSQIQNAYSVSEHASSLHTIPHFSSPSPVFTRPNKRKTATSDLIPWNKEIEHGFKRIQDISCAEVEWAQSSNRLVEKGGDELDSREEMSLTVKPRKRLILTTKLMQQVFCPPSASILSLDAKSNYEAIMYSIARLALGNACNLICGIESDSSNDDGNLKAKSPERMCDQYLLKVMEDFTNRAKQLEDNLLRLDKRASILDFRLDCQDLERFSVINRFARYHGRSPADAVNSSSSDPNAMSLKPCPQRYVSAHPMPRTLPERVPCLTIN
ncbi:hypothetical protein vseg_003026 [Gypsophila vaccaria]